jgi:hypothetical protein
MITRDKWELGRGWPVWGYSRVFYIKQSCAEVLLRLVTSSCVRVPLATLLGNQHMYKYAWSVCQRMFAWGTGTCAHQLV